MLYNLLCAFLVLDMCKFFLKSYNSYSIDVQTDFVLLAVWQVAAFKNNLSKHYPSDEYKSINISKFVENFEIFI